MVLNFLKNLFGSANDRYLASLQPVVAKINALAPTYQAMTDEVLKAQTTHLKARLAKGETLDSLLPEAFATMREAAHRVLGERPYDVQLMGGITLHKGIIAEMKTGEGKTLTATLPVYLNALTGQGVHVVTVNDYLAKRDAAWMGQVYQFLGLSCAALYHDLNDRERQQAYAADILYATNNELGFDYLRDNMKHSAAEQVQRGHAFAIVDEVDSILIDEARTPLIISGPTADKTELYLAADKIIPQLVAATDYQVDEKMRAVTLTEAGTDHAEQLLQKMGLLGGEGLYDIKNVTLVHHLNQALKAHTLFTKDKEYIIHQGEVMLIDEFTGRMTPGRRLSEGLHQAIEAKEKVEIQNENQTLASVTYQNYFRLYQKLAGMTGTAATEADEFEEIYGLQVRVIPTHVTVARVDSNDIIYRTIDEKNNAIVADIKAAHAKGQPVLVGTTSIQKSEHFAALLKKAGVPHQVLNARHHEQEAEIVAEAGRLGAVTIATNMAGRGTDIKLGGRLEKLLDQAAPAQHEQVRAAYEAEKAKVMAAGGLRVIGTERHESRRIDNQLRGRSGRQGDVGSSTFYISLQDDLMRIFAKGLDVLMGRLNMPEGEAINSRLVTNAIAAAQRKIEARHFDIRKELLKYDNILNDQRKLIYTQRAELMREANLRGIVHDFMEDVLTAAVARALPTDGAAGAWNVHGLQEECLRLLNQNIDVATLTNPVSATAETVTAALFEQAQAAYAARVTALTDPVMQQLERAVVLQVLDNQWRNHLQRLDHLRQGIHLRGYGQKNPLQEYKKESFEMFGEMLDNIKQETVALLMRLEVKAPTTSAAPSPVATPKARGAEAKTKPAPAAAEGNPYAHLNIGRNDPCPCGSGKKYKHCHGAVAQAQPARAMRRKAG